MTLLHWVALLRVPILFWLILGPGLILLMQPGMSLSRGFADLTPQQFFFVAAALWSGAVSLAAGTNLVLLYGAVRIGHTRRRAPSSGWVILVAALPAAATIGYLIWTAPQLDPGHRSRPIYLLLAVAALLLILVAAVILLWLALRFAIPRSGGSTPPAVILPMSWIPGAEKAYLAQPPTRIIHAAGKRLGWPLARWLGPGYLDPEGGLLYGHALSALLMLGYSVLYIVGGRLVTFRGSGSLGEARPVIGNSASALAFIVILVTFACWVLGAAAFFLERWRLRLIAPILVAALLVAGWPDRDHYFPVIVGTAAPQRPSPTAVILNSRSGSRVLIVASAGGGIQAAAWTTMVMAGLQRMDSRFRDTVRLVSGVSGGSVGLFYALRLYPGMGSKRMPLNELSALGGTSVMEAVAHGLAYPWSDRGQALEDCLGAAASNYITLGRYASLMLKTPGSLPGVILNATSVEDGSPVAFSTTTVFANNTGLRDWFETDGSHGIDVRLPTAARLSATFPYVSPSARPWPGKPSFRHFGDGGYFDNYGLYSAMAWLEDALGNLPPDNMDKLQVMLLAIESFPNNPPDLPASHGRLWQLLAPVNLLYNARTYSQRNRDDLEVSLFRNRFQNIYGLRPEQFTSVTLRYRDTDGCAAPPLSWHLTAVEKQCVAASWEALQHDPKTGQTDPSLQKALDFVAGR